MGTACAPQGSGATAGVLQGYCKGTAWGTTGVLHGVLQGCCAACLTVVAGAERAREHLLERARRVRQLVPEQERDQAPKRQRLVETPLVAQAPYRRHAAIRIAREDDAMIGLLVSRLEESLDRATLGRLHLKCTY